MAETKFGLVGSGEMARQHGLAILAVGGRIDRLLFKSDRDRAQSLADELGVELVTKSWSEFTENLPEALVFASPPGVMDEKLIEVARLGTKVLAEKPVSLNRETLNELKMWPNVRVALNRRYYESASAWTAYASNAVEPWIEIVISQPIFASNQWANFYLDGVHVIDILLKTFPSLRGKIPSHQTRTRHSVHTFFETSQGGFMLNLSLNTTLTHSLTCFGSHSVARLTPIETFKYYEGMKVEVDPNSNTRTYNPTLVSETRSVSNWGIKPGIFTQMQDFYNFVNRDNFYLGAEASDVIAAFEFLDVALGLR